MELGVLEVLGGYGVASSGSEVANESFWDAPGVEIEANMFLMFCAVEIF